jgi:hypothetical protein
MKISLSKALLVALTLVLFSFGCASTGGGAADAPAPPPPPAAPSAVGVWNMTIETPQGTQTPTITINGTAGDLSGSFGGPTGDLALDSISSDGDMVEFQVTIDIGGSDLVLNFSGTVEGDSMSGSFASDFGDFPATAERSTE